MAGTILIYGGTGYTGRLVARHARRIGLDVIVAGRDATKLAALATELGTSHRMFPLEDPSAVSAALEGCALVLNCAGPFARTARPLMEACVLRGVHYLDITAEYKVYALAESLSLEAEAAGVMLLPGVGWDVVPSDCLAVHTAARVDGPTRLRIALQVAGSMSRGSAISAGEIMGVGLLARRSGVIVAVPEAKPAMFDFGEGQVSCAPLSFGDLITAWHSTGIPNIEMFVHVSGSAFPGGDLSLLPDGPSEAERAAHPARVIAEVTGADGGIASARLETVNGYSYTPLAAAEAARRVLTGEIKPGFTTPAMVFGPGFAASIAGSRVIDL